MPHGTGVHPLQVDVLSTTPGILSVVSIAPDRPRVHNTGNTDWPRTRYAAHKQSLEGAVSGRPWDSRKVDRVQGILLYRDRRNAELISFACGANLGDRTKRAKKTVKAMIRLAFSEGKLQPCCFPIGTRLYSCWKPKGDSGHASKIRYPAGNACLDGPQNS